MNLCVLISSSVPIFDDGLSEIMICDFTSHMEVVSFLNIETPRIEENPPTDLPEDINYREQPPFIFWYESDVSLDISASRF